MVRLKVDMLAEHLDKLTVEWRDRSMGKTLVVLMVAEMVCKMVGM